LHESSGVLIWVQYMLITPISNVSKLAFLILSKLPNLLKVT